MAHGPLVILLWDLQHLFGLDKIWLDATNHTTKFITKFSLSDSAKALQKQSKWGEKPLAKMLNKQPKNVNVGLRDR